MPIDQFQTVYLWHDPRLGAVKIGKTNDWKRFCPDRIWNAISSNPTIRFIAAWTSDIAPEGGDAGVVAANGFQRAAFTSGAREWFRVDADVAFRHLESRWGPPRMQDLPHSVLERKQGPYDIFGSSPDKSGKSLSRLWLYRERQTNGYYRLADSSWWETARNLGSGSHKSLTFAPFGLETLAGYEWPGADKTPEAWGALNTRLRQFKNRLGDELAPGFLIPAARCGWVNGSRDDLEARLSAEGLVPFDINGPARYGSSERRG
jgi:hypothetical protein